MPVSDQNATARDAAAYVAELSAELATLARHHGLETLSHILDMARLEAEGVVGTERDFGEIQL